MNKKVKLAFVLAGIGIFAAAALRCVQMLCFFDYDTGFVTDSGLLTYIYCGAAIGVSLLCMLLCRVDKKLCARIETKRNAAAGASALLMCVFLFLCAAALLRDFYLYRNNQPTYFVQALVILLASFLVGPVKRSDSSSDAAVRLLQQYEAALTRAKTVDSKMSVHRRRDEWPLPSGLRARVI